MRLLNRQSVTVLHVETRIERALVGRTVLNGLSSDFFLTTFSSIRCHWVKRDAFDKITWKSKAEDRL